MEIGRSLRELAVDISPGGEFHGLVITQLLISFAEQIEAHHDYEGSARLVALDRAISHGVPGRDAAKIVADAATFLRFLSSEPTPSTDPTVMGNSSTTGPKLVR